MQEKHQNKKLNKPKVIKKKITGLDVDKMEYQQIVLSNSNYPDRDFFGKTYRY